MPSGGGFRFGAYQLDPHGRRLLRDDTPVPLKSRQFDVLVALVTRAGTLVLGDWFNMRCLLEPIGNVPSTAIRGDSLAHDTGALFVVPEGKADSKPSASLGGLHRRVRIRPSCPGARVWVFSW
jgi:hypothetical protein